MSAVLFNQITNPDFGRDYIFWAKTEGDLRISKRVHVHLPQSNAQRESRMTIAAKTVVKLIACQCPQISLMSENSLVLARANLMEMETTMLENCSTAEGRRAVIRHLDRAIQNLVPSNSSLLSCLFLGTNGMHRIFGHLIDFQDRKSVCKTTLEGAGLISTMAQLCLDNKMFRLVTFAGLHLTIHELGHAFASELFKGQKSNIIVYRDGGIFKCHSKSYLAPWKESMISAAGPLADMAFSSCLLATSALFGRNITLAIGGGAVTWMVGEFLYAFVSAYKGDRGDFGRIATQSELHVTLATIALVSQCALGIFACVKLLQ